MFLVRSLVDLDRSEGEYKLLEVGEKDVVSSIKGYVPVGERFLSLFLSGVAPMSLRGFRYLKYVKGRVNQDVFRVDVLHGQCNYAREVEASLVVGEFYHDVLSRCVMTYMIGLGDVEKQRSIVEVAQSYEGQNFVSPLVMSSEYGGYVILEFGRQDSKEGMLRVAGKDKVLRPFVSELKDDLEALLMCNV